MPKVNRNFLYVAVAIFLGGLASVLAVKYINQQVATRIHTAAPQKMRTVVVPVHNLKVGDVLSAKDLATRDIPVAYVPADALTPDDYESHLGQMLTTPLAQGAPISAMAMEPIANHFSDIIRPDRVAYTIDVSETNSISGLIVPGDHIDILLLLSKNSKDDIRPLLSDVLVLATGKHAKGVRSDGTAGNQGYSNLTLELTPKNAQRIGIAKKMGQLLVMLRSPSTKFPPNLGLLTASDLLGAGPRIHGGSVQFIIGGRQ